MSSKPLTIPTLKVPSRARAARLVVTAFVVVLLTVELMLVTPSVLSAAASLTPSSLAWLAVAAVATVASMVAFARVRQRMLRAAGVRVPLTQSVAVSYAAGALNTTMPGGGVVSTAYTFRRIRDWGAPTAVATWSVAVTGLVATATLSMVGATGIILGGGSTGSLLQSAVEVTAVLLLMAGIAYLISNPDRLAGTAGGALRRVNRLRGRPAETGYARLSRMIDALKVIRPSRRSWVDAWTLSLLNWVLDAACLAACCAAFGVQVSLPALLLTYTAGMAATSLTPLPGGLGVVEAALLLGLTAAGASWKAALAAVVVYRLLSVGSVALVGWGLIGARRISRAATRGEPLDPPAASTPVVTANQSRPVCANQAPAAQPERATRKRCHDDQPGLRGAAGQLAAGRQDHAPVAGQHRAGLRRGRRAPRDHRLPGHRAAVPLRGRERCDRRIAGAGSAGHRGTGRPHRGPRRPHGRAAGLARAGARQPDTDRRRPLRGHRHRISGGGGRRTAGIRDRRDRSDRPDASVESTSAGSPTAPGGGVNPLCVPATRALE